MWFVVKHIIFFQLFFITQNFVLKFQIQFQNNGDAMKKDFNVTRETLPASMQRFFVMVTSSVLMAVMKNLVVGSKLYLDGIDFEHIEINLKTDFPSGCILG